ncbi:hypothetical protein AB9F40_33915, partial [Rhizobium leguminosarum]
HLPLAEDVPFSWPDDLTVSMREIAVSFALTEPSTAFRPGISDGIAMTLDVIARARQVAFTGGVFPAPPGDIADQPGSIAGDHCLNVMQR